MIRNSDFSLNLDDISWKTALIMLGAFLFVLFAITLFLSGNVLGAAQYLR